jgi:hypothetical protein
MIIVLCNNATEREVGTGSVYWDIRTLIEKGLQNFDEIEFCEGLNQRIRLLAFFGGIL